MHALMINPEHTLPVIVNMDSRDFAELSCAGYIPQATGYKKQLEQLEEEMMGDLYAELDISSEIN